MVTFAICGLWHGEGWTYLIWGLLFGVYLSWSNWTEKLNRRIRKRLHIRKTAPAYIFYKVILTFILVSFAWIFFRASSLHEAIIIIRKIIFVRGKIYIGEWQHFIYSIFGVMLLIVIEIIQEYFSKEHLPFKSRFWFKEQLFYTSLIVLVLLIGVFDGGQFIYFQF
jgi:D-alanyl-lipoteichoic acid acyltransferase DltB (MBOAT superfamily)